MPSQLGTVLYRDGEVIFQEGDSGHHAYAIERGEVEISVVRDGVNIVLARPGKGEMVGEMAILDDKPRSATARAVGDCELLVITRQQIAGRLKQADPVLRLCVDVLMERFRDIMKTGFGVGSDTSDEPIPLPLVAERPAYTRRAAIAAMGEVRLEQELSLAIEQDALELAYQPIVRLDDHRPAGFEALVRWRHPDRGMVPPNVFIPLAENSGLIKKLDSWVMRTACCAAARFRDELPEAPPFVAVNCSPKDLADPGFVDQFRDSCARAGISPEAMKIEITESAFVADQGKVVQALNDCRGLGASIALDDFGTGYSSLSYLHRFPIDAMKIDRSFVMAMEQDTLSASIVRSLVNLGNDLGLSLVAEGIEEASQAEILHRLGCGLGQGYHFARPLAFEDARAFLDAGRDKRRHAV